MSDGLTEADLPAYFNRQNSLDAENKSLLLTARRLYLGIGIMGVVVGLGGIGVAALAIKYNRPPPPGLLEYNSASGMTQYLTSVDVQRISNKWATTVSNIYRYVRAREGYGWHSVQSTYETVGIMSTPQVAEQFRSDYYSGPNARDTKLANTASITVSNIVIMPSIHGTNTADVWFDTVKQYRGALPELARHWMARVTYRYTGLPETMQDREINPDGFQVTSYDLQSAPSEHH